MVFLLEHVTLLNDTEPDSDNMKTKHKRNKHLRDVPTTKPEPIDEMNRPYVRNAINAKGVFLWVLCGRPPEGVRATPSTIGTVDRLQDNNYLHRMLVKVNYVKDYDPDDEYCGDTGYYVNSPCL